MGTLRILRITLCALLLAGGAASAQLLAEVATTTAVAATINPAIRLPSGSYRVTSQIPPALLAKVNDGDGFGDWEAYTATGLATRLFPAHRHQLTTSFAMAGYWEQSRSEYAVGNERHVRYEYAGDGGGSVLLYVIETDAELVWLIGSSH